VDGDAGRGIGHLTLQAILVGELKYKRPKADPLNNTIHFQPFGNTSFCHDKSKLPISLIKLPLTAGKSAGLLSNLTCLSTDGQIRNPNFETRNKFE
jgi:hypothetical protein